MARNTEKEKERGITFGLLAIPTLLLIVALTMFINLAAYTSVLKGAPSYKSWTELLEADSLQSVLENITAENITSHWSGSTSVEDYALALQEAARNRIEPRAFGQEAKSMSPSLIIETETTEGTINICASTRENIVKIFCSPSEPLYCESPLLYNLVANIYDTQLRLDKVTLSHYEPFMEETLNARLEALNKSSPKAEVTQAKARGFEFLATYDDIFDGTVYVYQTDVAYLVKNPENIVFAGGMALDGQGRIVNCDVDTIFVAAHKGDEILFTTFISGEAYHGETWELREQNGYDTVSQAVLEGLAES